MKNKNLKDIITFLQGMVMGVVEIIPGVSGSTFALVLGFYDRFIKLLHDISNFVKSFFLFILNRSRDRRFSVSTLKNDFKEIELKFGVILFVGMITAIALLSNVIYYFRSSYPQYLYALFFGLILSSIVVPLSKIKVKNIYNISLLLFTAMFTFIALGIRSAEPSYKPEAIFLFFAGVFAISGLLLPGVSGSFILLMLGVYDYIITIVKHFFHFEITSENLFKLVIFALGILTGFIFFVRLVKYGLDKYPDKVLAFVTGIMIGSLRVIYPFFYYAPDYEVRLYTEPWNYYPTAHSNPVIILGIVILGIILVQVLALYSNKSGSDSKSAVTTV